MLEALTMQTETLARQKPLLMIFEDAHWTHPDKLGSIWSNGGPHEAPSAGLVIVIYRPEFEVLGLGGHTYRFFALTRLGERDIDAMIDRVVGNKSLSASIRQDIIERTERYSAVR